jgi:hypothetical protein
MTTPVDTSAYLPIVASVVRTALAVAGGLGFAWAQAVTADQFSMIVSTLLALGAFVWGIYQKIAAVRALKTAALAPATTVTPTLPS